MAGSASGVIVLDNGAGLCKAGFAGEQDPVAVVPNCLGRPAGAKRQWLAADQLLAPELDVTSLAVRRPSDRGYLINVDLQREIWDRVFRSLLRADPSRSSLLLVEPLFAIPSVQRATDELVFEDFGFQSLCVADSPSLAHAHQASRDVHISGAQCSLVVDCGFSFTHAAPVVHDFTLNYGVRRLDLGGKALTNYLKELVSFRSVNVLDETFLVDDAKEKLCFVSLDVARDLRLARRQGNNNPFRCTYVLPDGVTCTRGFVKDEEEAWRCLSSSPEEQPEVHQTAVKRGTAFAEEETAGNTKEKRIDLTKNEFSLCNERFLVPEMIFRPADLGMNEAGLAECIVRAVHSCHPRLHPVLWERIILTGGTTLFPQFAERLERELRPLVRDDYRLKITTQEEPILGVWRGGSLLASSPDFEAMCVTKQEYEELGSARCRRRFFH
ncbi:actin-related protein 6 [Wolffia australiana]